MSYPARPKRLYRVSIHHPNYIELRHFQDKRAATDYAEKRGRKLPVEIHASHLIQWHDTPIWISKGSGS